MQNSKSTARGLLVIVVTILSSTLGAILFVALWPYLPLVGRVLTGFLMVIFGCAAWLALAGTFHLASIMHTERLRRRMHARVIVAGNVVILPDGTGGYAHLSAEHEAARAQVTVKELPPPESDEATVKELYGKGLSYRDIVKATGMKYHRVQGILAEKA